MSEKNYFSAPTSLFLPVFLTPPTHPNTPWPRSSPSPWHCRTPWPPWCPQTVRGMAGRGRGGRAGTPSAPGKEWGRRFSQGVLAGAVCTGPPPHRTSVARGPTRPHSCSARGLAQRPPTRGMLLGARGGEAGARARGRARAGGGHLSSSLSPCGRRRRGLTNSPPSFVSPPPPTGDPALALPVAKPVDGDDEDDGGEEDDDAASDEEEFDEEVRRREERKKRRDANLPRPFPGHSGGTRRRAHTRTRRGGTLFTRTRTHITAARPPCTV